MSATIKTIINALNKEMKQFEGQKINVGEFHDTARQIAVKIFRKLGVKELVYSVWAIKYGYYREIFKLELDLIEDKRCKMDRKGKIVTIVYTMKDCEKYKNMTLEEYFVEMEMQSKLMEIKKIDKYIEQNKKEIEKLLEMKEKIQKSLE